jgi:WD40 repeat protein
MRTYKLKKLKRIHGIHFTPDSTRLLALGGTEVRGVETAVWLDLASGENVDRMDEMSDCYTLDPAMSRIVLAGAHQWQGIAPIQWKELPAGDAWHPFPGTPKKAKSAIPTFQEITGIAFDAAGERLAVSHYWRSRRAAQSDDSGYEHEVVILCFDPPQLLTRIWTPGSAQEIAFNADGTQIAFAGGVEGDPPVEVYDIATGKQLYQFEPPGTVTRCVLFTPDNRLIVANGRNVYVLPADKAETLFTLAGHPKQVNAVALTPDGKRILTASHDGTIRVWNADTGEALKAFDWQIGAITAVAFAPDGLTCAAVGLNGNVVVWDADE